MAGLRLEIRIDDKGTAVIKKVEGAHRNLEKQVVGGSKRMSKAMDFARKRAQALGQSIKRGMMIAKLAMAGLAVATAVVGAKFEQSMANTGAILGKTREEMERLTAVARGLGATTVFSASQASEAMYSLASAGQTMNQIVSSSPAVLLFAGAAATDLGSAAETLVQTLAIFNLKADQSTRVVNVFAAAIGASLLNAERLREGMSQVGSTAHSMGLGLEETVATLGLLNSAGMVGGIAGTRLKNVLTRLAAPNQVLQGLLGKTTLQINGLRGSMAALEKADPGQIFKAFGRIGAPAVLVMRHATEEMERLEKAVTGTQKAQEMFNIQMNTVASQTKIFKSQLQENMISVFMAARDAGFDVMQSLTAGLKDLKPWIVGIVVKMIELTKAFKNLVTENAGTIKLFLGIATALSAVVFGGTAAAAAVGLLSTGLALLMSPVGMIIALAAGLTAAWVAWGDQIKEVLGKVKGWFFGFVDTVGEVAGKIWEKIRWPFVKLVEIAQKASGLFKKIFPDAAASVEGMLEVLKDKGGDAVEFLTDKGKAEAAAFAGDIKAVVTGVGGAITETKAAVEGFFEDIKTSGEAAAGAIQAPGTPGAGGDAAEEEKAAREALKKKLELAAQEARIAAEIEDKRRAALVRTIGFESAATQEWLEARLELIRSNFDEQEAAAGGMHERLAELEIARSQEVAAARMEHEAAVLEHFLETNKIMVEAVGVLGGAFDDFFDLLVRKEESSAKLREAIMRRIKATFIKNTSEMVKTWIKDTLRGLLITSAAKDKEHKKEKLKGAKEGAVKAYSAFASIPIIGPALGAIAAAAAFAFLIAFQKGGQVPGVGQGRDTVPAVLEPQEFVVRRTAAQSVGPEALDFINRTGTLPPSGAGLGAGGDVYLQVDARGSDADTIAELDDYLEDEVLPRVREITGRRRGLTPTRR
jgi:TP901 family phage tail tape measure protein